METKHNMTQQNINHPFPLFIANPDDIVNLDLAMDRVEYLTEPPEGLTMYSRNHFTINHDNNDAIKNFVITSINDCISAKNFTDVYNAKYREELANRSKPMMYLKTCDRRQILGNCIQKRTPFSWQITTFHEASPRINNSHIYVPSDYHKFEINIYQETPLQYTIEFHNLTCGSTAFHDLYNRTKNIIEGGIIRNRLAFLKLYATYNDETTSEEEAVFQNHVDRYLFNPEIGKEILSYLS